MIRPGDQIPIYTNPLRAECLEGYTRVVRVWGRLACWTGGHLQDLVVRFDGQNDDVKRAAVDGTPPT